MEKMMRGACFVYFYTRNPQLFNHYTVCQANTNNGDTMQDTGVTVTLMKFFYRMNLLTGDSRYADAFETSLYNAYLGAVNTEK